MGYKILTKAIEVEFSAGSNIKYAIREAIYLADLYDTKIKFEFNSVTIIISPNTKRTISDIQNDYSKKLILEKVVEA